MAKSTSLATRIDADVLTFQLPDFSRKIRAEREIVVMKNGIKTILFVEHRAFEGKTCKMFTSKSFSNFNDFNKIDKKRWKNTRKNYPLMGCPRIIVKDILLVVKIFNGRSLQDFFRAIIMKKLTTFRHLVAIQIIKGTIWS